jgi:hypothetical protein
MLFRVRDRKHSFAFSPIPSVTIFRTANYFSHNLVIRDDDQLLSLFSIDLPFAPP